jgi:hypothetical protein
MGTLGAKSAARVPEIPTIRTHAGELPPARTTYIAPESGPAGRLEQADEVAETAQRAARDAQMAAARIEGKRAAVIDREFDGAKVQGQTYSSDPSAIDAPKVQLSNEEARELRRMKAELDNLEFTPRTRVEIPGAERGKDEIWVAGAAGAPVYSDITGALKSPPTRHAVAEAIGAFLDGRHNATGQRALEVARLRLQGDPTVSQPMLPPSAGDPPLRVSDLDDAADVPRGGAPLEDEALAFERFAADVEDLAGVGGSRKGREPGEEGKILTALGVRAGGAVAGGLTGAASGDTPEEKVKRALIYGAAGFAAPSLMRSNAGRTAAREALAARPVMGAPRTNPLAGTDVFLRKFPEELRQGVREVLERNGGFDRQRRGVLSQPHVERLAETISVDVWQRLTPGTALPAEAIRAYADTVATLQSKADDLARKISGGQSTDADLLAFQQTRAELDTTLASLMGARSEAGRALAQFRVLSRVLQSGDVNLIRQAANAPGVREESARLAGQLAQLPPDPIARYRFLQQEAARGATLGQKVVAYYYANILSGLKTTERNTLGNLANLSTEIVTGPAAASLDVLRSKLTGKPREVFFGELKPAVVGAMGGLEKGLREFVFRMRYGIGRDALLDTVRAAEAGSSFDAPRFEFGGGGANPFNWPGRILDATDGLFRSIAREMELSRAAFAQAKKEGKRGQALIERMVELQTGTDDVSRQIQDTAERYSARAVFQEKPGPVVGWLQASKQKFPGLAFLTPFVKVPGAIARQGFEFSPAGFGMKAARQGGRAGVQAQARAALGSMLLAPLAWLAASGRLSGSGPRDAEERARLYESGWRPNSIKIFPKSDETRRQLQAEGLTPGPDGGYWVSYTLFQPVSVPAAVMANGFDAWREAGGSDKDAVTIAGTVVGRSIRSALDYVVLVGPLRHDGGD